MKLFLSITAITGFAQLVVLSSVMKILYSCSAITHLPVGIFSQPVVAVYFTLIGIAEENFIDECMYSSSVALITFTFLTAVFMLITTAISVDRLLALLLGLKYRHVVVALKRVGAFVLYFWIASSALTLMMFKNFAILKMYGYALISPSLLPSVCCYSQIVFGLRHHQTYLGGLH